jgi:hypothetical protein
MRHHFTQDMKTTLQGVVRKNKNMRNETLRLTLACALCFLPRGRIERGTTASAAQTFPSSWDVMVYDNDLIYGFS